MRGIFRQPPPIPRGPAWIPTAPAEVAPPPETGWDEVGNFYTVYASETDEDQPASDRLSETGRWLGSLVVSGVTTVSVTAGSVTWSGQTVSLTFTFAVTAGAGPWSGWEAPFPPTVAIPVH